MLIWGIVKLSSFEGPSFFEHQFYPIFFRKVNFNCDKLLAFYFKHHLEKKQELKKKLSSKSSLKAQIRI